AGEDVVTEIHREVVVAEKGSGDHHAVGEPAGLVLREIREPDTEPRPIAELLNKLGPFFVDDYSDVLDSGVSQIGEAMLNDRRVRHRNELLGQRIRQRTQPGTRASGEHKAFHRRSPARIRRSW